MKAALQAHRDAINVNPRRRQVIAWAMRQNVIGVPTPSNWLEVAWVTMVH